MQRNCSCCYRWETLYNSTISYGLSIYKWNFKVFLSLFHEKKTQVPFLKNWKIFISLRIYVLDAHRLYWLKIELICSTNRKRTTESVSFCHCNDMKAKKLGNFFNYFVLSTCSPPSILVKSFATFPISIWNYWMKTLCN